MKHLNKLSKNVVEKSVQDWYLANGFQSLKSGWPDFVFWKKSPDGKTIYQFVEVKQHNNDNIRNNQRKVKNIFRSFNLDYRVAYGLLPDGSPNFQKRKGVNGHIQN
jgi:hypothetical protein